MKRFTPTTKPSKRRSRSGAFLIIAMICLVLTGTLLGTLLQMVSVERRQARLETHRLQADWLAESAIDRAAARLSGDASYKGETWTVAAKDLGGPHAGRVEIQIRPATDSGRKTIEVIAHYPAEGPRIAKRTKRIVYGRTQEAAQPATGASKASAPAEAEKPAR